MSRPVPRPFLAALMALAVIADPATARPGDVEPVIGTEFYDITQVDGSIASIALPPGLSTLRAKRDAFRYGIRLDETVMTVPVARSWSNNFCGQFDLRATRHRIAGGGATGRTFKFNCQ